MRSARQSDSAPVIEEAEQKTAMGVFHFRTRSGATGMNNEGEIR